MKIKYLVISAVLILMTVLAGCNYQESTKSGEMNDESKLKIYTTLYPLEDFAKKIGGEHVEVENIIPPGSNAHTFEPTSKDIVNIASANAFIYNGLGMESFANKVAAALEEEETLMVEATKGIKEISHVHDHEHHEDEEEHHEDEEEHHEGDEHNHGDVDPHVWLDPIRATVLAENIKDALIQLMPEAKEDFEKNFDLLIVELEKLDHEFHELMESKENPEMIVSHAAYGYWEESYGIEQIAVAGLSPTNEPTQKELEKIIDIANEKQIKYVIFEQNVTPKVADVIQKEINAQPLHLHNVSVLTEEDIQNGEDYFSLMRKNLLVLDKALK